MSGKQLLLLSLFLVPDPSSSAYLRAPFLQYSGSGDMVQQARAQADNLKETLRSLSQQPQAAPILKKVFAGKNSDCIDSMDKAIEAIQTSTKQEHRWSCL